MNKSLHNDIQTIQLLHIEGEAEEVFACEKNIDNLLNSNTYFGLLDVQPLVQKAQSLAQNVLSEKKKQITALYNKKMTNYETWLDLMNADVKRHEYFSHETRVSLNKANALYDKLKAEPILGDLETLDEKFHDLEKLDGLINDTRSMIDVERNKDYERIQEQDRKKRQRIAFFMSPEIYVAIIVIYAFFMYITKSYSPSSCLYLIWLSPIAVLLILGSIARGHVGGGCVTGCLYCVVSFISFIVVGALEKEQVINNDLVSVLVVGVISIAAASIIYRLVTKKDD